MNRGFFEIGIYHSKTPANVGTLWRSAFQMGASGIFTIGHRYPRQASDTVKAYRNIPWRQYASLAEFWSAIPYDCPVVAVEMGGGSLHRYTHPERAVYLLGSEDGGLPPDVMAKCHRTVSLPALRTESYNVAVAGSLVMWDRQVKCGAFA